jgi:Flp pilus assembly protein CpaB
MGESLNPSAVSRLLQGWRPDWTRTVAARRAAAGGLVVLAAVAALRPDPSDGHSDIVVAARDLSPGAQLSAADLIVESHPVTTIPDGALSDPSTAVGSTLTGPARRGETITDVRLLSPRLADVAAGPDARIVPLHLADTALLDLIHPGDVVDVLAVDATGLGESDKRPLVMATNAIVVLVSEKRQSPGSGDDRLLLVALPATTANQVAGASLTQAITLTLR